MRLIHAKWAAEHDWYCGHYGDAHQGTLTIVCRDYEQALDGTWVPCTVEFTDFAALRTWAGY